MSWCDSNKVDYIFGLARNSRLTRSLKKAFRKVKKNYIMGRGQAKKYVDFRCRTLKSWTRSRRVVGKAEYLRKGENPRFVVTSLYWVEGPVT